MAGCGDDGGGRDDDGNGPGVVSIGGATDNDDSATGDDTAGDETFGGDVEVLFLEVTPGETVLEVDLGTPASQQFLVNAVLSDGSAIDVTADATWAVSDPVVGAMNGNTLEIPAFVDASFTSAIVTAGVGSRTGQAQITIAAYATAEDFFFVLPFNDPAGEQSKPLTFSTEVKSMDVFVSMDTTGSMSGAVNNLQQSMATTIIPGIQALVPDTQFGGGTFEDFPVSPYGATTDSPFELFQEITGDIMAVQNAVLSFSLGSGADGPESGYEALYQIATGEGLNSPAPTNVPPNASGIGGVGFREGALPIVVSVTDAVSHDTVDASCSRLYAGAVAGVAHSQQEATDALNNICARVVQIALAQGTCSALADGIALAEATGSIIPPEAWDIGGRPAGCAADQCCTGQAGAGMPTNADGLCPMAYLAQSNGTGVDTSFSSAIQLLAAYGSFGVTSVVTGGNTDTEGNPLPDGTSTADFIKGVTPSSHGPVPLPGVPDPTIGPESFENVIPDTDVIFDVRAFNDFVEQGNQPRLFTANIEVLADTCGELDSREVFILVPPASLPPPG
ncbi:MAG: hypothetical protein AAF799_02590 [Myxococcota bacterium]